ncbi:hypothetical protein [Aeromonas popoffii]|uniref:hypothetical protein n=1 Tax=Aeromonas popoffii TaxID=70856 RepID=UPI0030D1E4B0
MRLNVLLLGAVLGLLGGCATPSPTVTLNQPPIDMTPEQLSGYGVQEEETGWFRPVGDLPGKGYVAIRYLIDSNGNLFSSERVASEPPGVLDLFALSGLAKTRYRVAEQNPDAIPVRVVSRLDIEVK